MFRLFLGSGIELENVLVSERIVSQLAVAEKNRACIIVNASHPVHVILQAIADEKLVPVAIVLTSSELETNCRAAELSSLTKLEVYAPAELLPGLATLTMKALTSIYCGVHVPTVHHVLKESHVYELEHGLSINRVGPEIRLRVD